MARDQISVIVADFEKFARGEVIALGLEVNANLRDQPPLGTPVDTGWAAANWVPSVGAPFSGSGDAGGEPTEAQIASRAQEASAGLSAVLAWNLDSGLIFSTNNVPYIGRLNEGWSPQSPAGFVQIAIEKAIRDTALSAGSRRARNSPPGR